jgi:endothelin-converting enzyme/putative endopeptidase
MSANEFAVANPGLAWASYAKTAGVASLDEIIVGQPSFFQQSQSVLAETSVDTLKAYLAFQTINTYAPVLTEDLERMHFAFHETVLSGVTEQEPLWRRGVDACNAMLGMPVGQLYVEKHFSPLAKKRMNELVGNLLRAFEQRIEKLEWMGNGTKAQAKEKLALFTPKIGYPDKWKDYSSVQIVRDDIVGNLGRIAEFEHQYALNKLGKPIDRTEWYMPPQTVNAYYNPLMNEIVFPAAILQPPFFNLEADDAVNYGAIGAVIGHEISHGFDDAGSRFDGRGNLRNWWTENDRTEFEKRANRLVSQYDAYEPLPGMPLSGRFTLGENIGDLGGLSVAYTAYLLSLEGKPAAVLDGFTGEQRFFIGWAQVWRRKYREEEMRKRIKTDPHSPSAYRCNGIVSNLDGFYEAFGIGSEDPMYIAPEKRVRIW